MKKTVRSLCRFLAAVMVLQAVAVFPVGAAETGIEDALLNSDSEEMAYEVSEYSEEASSTAEEKSDDIIALSEEPDESSESDTVEDGSVDKANEDEENEADTEGEMPIVEEEPENDELLGTTTGPLGFDSDGGTYTLSSDGKTLTLDGTGAKDSTLYNYFLCNDRYDYSKTLFDPKKVTSIMIKNYEVIGNCAFDGYRTYNWWNNLKTITINSGVTKIENAAFYDLDIESISIPEGVEEIDRMAFCNTNLKSVTLPTTVKKIGDMVFMSCYSLESISLNNGLETIGYHAFYHCPKIKELVIPDTVTSNNDIGIGWVVERFGEDDVYYEELETLSIPISAMPTKESSLDGSKIDYSPIEPSAFFKKLIFTKGNGQWPGNRDESDDNTLLSNWENEEIVRAPFEVVFAEGVTSIPRNAFQYYDKYLTKVTIAPSVTVIEEDAFEGCKSLQQVFFAEGGTEHRLSIKWDAFRNTNNLKTIEFPNNIKELETYDDAFVSWSEQADENGRSVPDGIRNVTFRNPRALIISRFFTGEGGYGYDGYPIEFSQGCTFHAYPFDFSDYDFSKGFSIKTMVERVNGSYKTNYPQGYYHFRSLGNVPKPTPTPKPVPIKGLTLSSYSVTKYSDDIKSGTRVTITATLTPANVTNNGILFGVTDDSDPITGVITKSTEYDQENGQYTIYVDLKQGVTGTATVYVETDDQVSSAQFMAKCRITIKERERACDPYAKFTSGNDGENGAMVALYSQTPRAQIFYSSDRNLIEESDSHVEYSDDAGRYVSTANGVKEYTSPLVLGRDITADDNTVYAVAYKKGMKKSLMCTQTFAVPAPASVWGDITEEDQAGEFGVNADKLTEAKYLGIWSPEAQLKDAALVYTGKAVTLPNLRVYYGTKLLKEGTDYSLTYSSNTEPGNSAKIKVTLKGNYSGTKTFDFTIGKCPVADAGAVTWTPQQVNAKSTKGVYAQQRPDLKVTVKATGKMIKTGDGLIVSYKHNGTGKVTDYVDEPGIYTAYLDNTDTSRYSFPKGENAIVLADAVFCVGGEQTAMSTATVSRIAAQSVTEQGVSVEPDFGVTYRNKPLTGKKKGDAGDAHYTYEFRNNTGAGTATLVIEGTNEECDGLCFNGIKTSTFKIKGIAINSRDITISGINAEYAYTGTPINPAYAVKNGEDLLVEGTDYSVAYAKNAHTEVGTVSMTFTGMGIYSGSVKKSFKIVQNLDNGQYVRDSRDQEWSVGTEYKYVKSGTNPIVHVYAQSDPERRLVEGKDYTVKYSNNKSVGSYDPKKVNKSPSLTVTFKGGYKGSKTLYYTITKAGLEESGCHMELADVVASTSPNKFAQKPVVTDRYGNVLKQGTDYEKLLKYTYDEDIDVTYTVGSGKDKRIVSESRNKEDEVMAYDVIPAGAVIRVTATGKDNYEGTVSSTFTVMADKISNLKFSVDPAKKFYYTGSPVVPQKGDLKVQVRKGAKWEDAGAEIMDCFDIIGYSNNIKKGTATLTVRGKNGYAGTAAVKFAILAPQ